MSGQASMAYDGYIVLELLFPPDGGSGGVQGVGWFRVWGAGLRVSKGFGFRS